MSEQKEKTKPKIELPASLRILRKLPLPKKLGLLGKIYGQKLALQGVGWVETSNSLLWKLDLRNSTHRWIVFGDYEGPGFIRWAKNWVESDSVVIDSGANIGQVLLYLAPKIRSGRYLAFEPFPLARDWLHECLQQYRVWPVRVEEFGLGQKLGFASLSGQWGGEAAVGSHTELKPGEGEIRMTTLDQYAEENSLTKIRLWKLDMEGGEEAALRGAHALLKKQAIQALVLETDPERFYSVTKMLETYGYFAASWNGKKFPDQRVESFGNILFLPKKQ
ncbi:MAG: FkbM family methyltransferase [Proteobacteria bacterium]|nr:FkbM family methyltransferase [Pseudomonadota bacterium]